MKHQFLLTPIVTFALSGCFYDSATVNPNTIKFDDNNVHSYIGTIKVSDKVITGDVVCNGHRVDNGHFEVSEGETFSCQLGHVELGYFTAPDYDQASITSQANQVAQSSNFKLAISFDFNDLHGANAFKILESINSCKNEDNICINELDVYDIEAVYPKIDDDTAVNSYLSSKAEEATDDVGKTPSSHVNYSVVPSVSQGASNNLNSAFVSAEAESSYAYKPSNEAKVLTKSQLTDIDGNPIVGINFFSANSTGLTDENGEFEYLWGDKLTFGIDTFEFGTVKGNKINYKITDVAENNVKKANIQALIKRYALNNNGKLEITEEIHETFALYPNVINELINLSLPNGSQLDDSHSLPNEFENQFSHGLTAEIDKELKSPPISSYLVRRQRQPQMLSLSSGNYVTQSLKTIFSGVETFHVFNDNRSFYGATGYTRGMQVLNLSNLAFPIMMARTDKNQDIPFGKAQAWTREGRPYIVTWPNITNLPEVPKVSKDNATFSLPFVAAGQIGLGKVVFMGNGMYPSILSCPDNYWNNRSVSIDSQNKSCTSSKIENQHHDDNGSMQLFFSNLFTWFNKGNSTDGISVATNIDKAHFAQSNSQYGMEYDFFISPNFKLGNVEKLERNGFSNLSVTETPILILRAYQVKVIDDGRSNQFIADLDNPNLSQDDVTALIKYIDQGGNILFMDAIQTANPEPIGRLADAAGMSVGGANITPTRQAFCGSSYYCQTQEPNLHVRSGQDMVVLERFADNDGKQPFTVNQDGSVEWIKDETKIKFEIPSYSVAKLDAEGKPVLNSDRSPVMVTKRAQIFVNSDAERQAAIKELQTAFKGTPVCSSDDYQWEFNCIETRDGHGKTVRGAYHRPDFDRYEISPDVIESMVKAANLGANFNKLYQHEIYYRTSGTQGNRLSSTELNQTYDNLSTWMWNDNQYEYQTEIQDELGFEQAVQFLNCYTNDKHQGGALCPADLKLSLINNKMIHGDGELEGQLNPSYPLNYMEKPLTRIMLGRSFWDYQITVDTTMYPGRTSGSTLGTQTATIQTGGEKVSYSAGNNQSTGLWAPQLKDVTINGGVAATITVMFADDLTGKAKHEKSLNRPPRMQTSYAYNGTTLTFKAPYGGLIYIKPNVEEESQVQFTLEGTEKAAYWKNGNWKNSPAGSTAPIAEVDTGSFIYTTPVKNVESIDLNKFAKDMNRFAEAASDFYGRDEVSDNGLHRRFTYPELKEFRHRFVNDVQISVGAAHSGYPVMNSSFNANASNVPTNPINDWLLWHEIGHNLAAAPFSAAGSTEVTNNLLALYMQELDGRNNDPQMDRIILDIKKAPGWLDMNNGHAWSHGNAGTRLVMFGQLKVWAASYFDINKWYSESETKPSIYGTDNGWNMFKLMHRKARGDKQGDQQGKNYCSPSETGLSGGDLMMVCSSYVSGYDLSEFFSTWNVGEVSMTNPDGTKVYNGGITQNGLSKVAELNLNKPSNSPLRVNSVSYYNK